MEHWKGKFKEFKHVYSALPKSFQQNSYSAWEEELRKWTMSALLKIWSHCYQYKNTWMLGHLGGLLVKHLTLELCSDHDFKLVRSSLVLGSTLSMESAEVSLSLAPSFPLPLPFSVIYWIWTVELETGLGYSRKGS